MAGNEHEPAPWENRRQPTRAFNPQQPPAQPAQPASQNPYPPQQGYQQPYQGPGYGQNPMYGQQPYPSAYGQPAYGQPYNQAAYTAPFGGQPMGWTKPHRGTLLIILTVCSFAVCAICGVVGFFMAKNDLAEIKAGVMDPSGEQMTKVAYWVCLVHVCLVAFFLLFYAIMMVVVFAAAPGHRP